MMHHRTVARRDKSPETVGFLRHPFKAAFAFDSIKRLLVSTVLLAALTGLQAQTTSSPRATANQTDVPAPTAYQVVEQGANYNVWQRETYEKAPDGTIVAKPHKYTELASGLNFLDSNGQYQASREEIDILPDGTAAATHGQIKAGFPVNIYSDTIKLTVQWFRHCGFN